MTVSSSRSWAARSASLTMESHTAAFPDLSAFSRRQSFTADSASAVTCTTVDASDGDHGSESAAVASVWRDRKVGR